MDDPGGAHLALKTVLVVEDNDEIAQMQRFALEGLADVQLITGDFDRVFLPATWSGVDVAVVDLMLPALDGETILAYLLDAFPAIRRVICTAKPTYELLHLNGLAHVVLQKPFRLEDLVAAVLVEQR